MWQTNGIPVCVMEGYQGAPKCISDSINGVVAIWLDCRNDRQDLYAQRINGDGKTLWDSNGVFIITAIDTTEQMYTTFDLVSDNRSGAIVAWKDYRAGNWDIYCQRVDSSGVLRWGEGGLGVCTDKDWEGHPIMVPDGAGGAIIAWAHAPAGKAGVRANVCAQRVDSMGNLKWGGVREEPWGDRLPREVNLGQNFPNPFNSTTIMNYELRMKNPPVRTTLKIYNILGEEVKTLVDEPQRPGFYRVVWDGRDKGGRDVSSGIYFYQLRVERFSQTRKMLLLR